MGDIKPKPAQYFINLMEEILEKKRKNQTNEGWFCNLPTEEKAKVLYKFYCDGRNDELQVYVNINANSFKEWLKQPHSDKE